MKKTTFYISFIILILNFSCKTDNKTDLKKLAELDAKKSKELITQILKDEKKGILWSNCIAEEPRTLAPVMINDFDKYVKELLNIKDTIHYKLQLKLVRKFKIKPNLVPNKNIVTTKQFEEFAKKAENGKFEFWDWLDNNCKNGYCSISKPMFNETFDLAYVIVGRICGNLCGVEKTKIYEYIDGKWILKKDLDMWVS